eukprot:12393798-Karenia_brevis.AAC.1
MPRGERDEGDRVAKELAQSSNRSKTISEKITAQDTIRISKIQATHILHISHQSAKQVINSMRDDGAIKASSLHVRFQDTCDAVLSDRQDVMIDASRLVSEATSRSTRLIVVSEGRLLTMGSLPLT